MTACKTIALIRRTFVGKVMFLFFLVGCLFPFSLVALWGFILFLHLGYNPLFFHFTSLFVIVFIFNKLQYYSSFFCCLPSGE